MLIYCSLPSLETTVTTLAEFLESLSYIELADMQGASEGDGVVTSQWRNRIITIINHGLNTLHSEFSLKTASEEVYPGTGKSTYKNTKPDFVRFDQILLGDERLFLNDTTIKDPRVMISSWNSFEMNGFTDEDVVTVLYRAKNTPLTKASPNSTVIDIPPRFDELLRSYVAWHIFGGYKDQAFVAKAAENKMRFQELLQELRELNLTNEYNPELPARWFDKGWGLVPPAKLPPETE